MPAITQNLTCYRRVNPVHSHIPPLSRLFTTTAPRLRDTPSQSRRSDFDGQGWTSTYEPGGPTVGPLAQSANLSTPKLTPAMLKAHLDKFVVGQDKAKKVTSVAIFNHYQRIRELKRQQEEEQERWEQQRRWERLERERMAHPVENEYPGHTDDLSPAPSPFSTSTPSLPSALPALPPVTTIEKSNLLLLGPSGVGKTYILSTLARVLSVPFTTIDCSTLTQAGYIGSDIESSIERLLLAANHNIAACETGIIFFDELDKLAKPAVMTHGRDVSGEGVQQGLLKMIEGTMVSVSAKGDRSRKSEQANARSGGGERGGERGREAGVGAAQGGKTEQFTIDTTNILFVFAGAFVGLEKIITSRLSSGTGMGFGASLRSASPISSSSSHRSSSSSLTSKSPPPTPLTHVTPSDLQTYGLIPELLGRIPILATLTPLTLAQLVSILTEPHNSLVAQYTALFHTSGITLKFTTAAIWTIAERAFYRSSSHPAQTPLHSSHTTATSPSSRRGHQAPPLSNEGGGIGARGLRSILEDILAEIMFWGPGSAIRYVLVDEAFVREQGGLEPVPRTTERSASISASFTIPPSGSASSSATTSRRARTRNGSEPGRGEKNAARDERREKILNEKDSASTSTPTPDDASSLMPRCWGRGQGRLLDEAWEKEEREWVARKERERRESEGSREGHGEEGDGYGADGEAVGSFERFRSVGGSGM